MMNSSRLIDNRVSQDEVAAMNGFQSRLGNWLGFHGFFDLFFN